MMTRKMIIAASVSSAMVVTLWAPEMLLGETAVAPTTVAASTPVADLATPTPLTADELEILVARIALYPDDLVAVIAASSLHPLQVVEAGRFLESSKTNASLKPKSTWDGSVVSLMNYPEIVTMMANDLDWTQSFGTAIVNQQDDVLNTIQQLRDQAVSQGVLKTDDKMTVVNEGDNIVIQPTNPEAVYIPTYPPEMFYTPGYVYPPMHYYDHGYSSYYDPYAPFFAGVVTGIVWAGIVDWNDGVWGGDWDGNDFDFDCNNCFNDRNFSGKVNLRDADWSKIDRSKINFDKNQIKNIDRTKLENNLRQNERNNTRVNTGDININRAGAGPSGQPVRDVRSSTLEGLKAKPGNKPAATNRPAAKPKASTRPAGANRGNNASRPAAKAKPAARVDNRPRNPSPMGNPSSGRSTRANSSRGSSSRCAPPACGGARSSGSRGGGSRGGGSRGGGGRSR